MHQEYILPDPWSIIEEGFNPENVKSSESLMSIGNGAMGQRANFEEDYSGPTFQGSYIGGVYYPDKTRVGWWKNGYPEYFAKVLNAPSWIGIKVRINDEKLDLKACKNITDFRRELNMKEGWLGRSFKATLQNGVEIAVEAKRFLSLDIDELGVIHYQVTPLNQEATISYEPYIDSGITNEDSNWDDQFWNTYAVSEEGDRAFIMSHTMKTEFHVGTFMESRFKVGGRAVELSRKRTEKTSYQGAGDKKYETQTYIGYRYETSVNANEPFAITKYAGYVSSLNHAKGNLQNAASQVLDTATQKGFKPLLEAQKKAW